MGAIAQVANEKIRGPDLAVLVKRSNGVPFEEGLRRADEGKHVIVSNARLSKALVGSEEWRKVKEAFACWSGTMTAYVEPGQKLPEKVEYVDSETGHRWVFSVPEQFRGKTNAILVAEHPDYTLEIDGNNRVVHATAVDLVENFPAKDGWYNGDPKHDIPIVSQSGPDRHLWRIGQRVGPAARCDFVVNGRYVVLGVRPSVGLGVVVEAAAGGTPLMAGTTKLVVAQEPGKLIITGSDEQIQAFLRVARSQNLL